MELRRLHTWLRPSAPTLPANQVSVTLIGFLKTDDRMRLAKERREERDRSLGKKAFCRPFTLYRYFLTRHIGLHLFQRHGSS
uniref:Uncharacterized protein n=1 Tax=Hippocampus comes TaxID=109280 RepID=A0A3Q2YDL4_HIPCM